MQVFLVGGAVRDSLLGLPSHDKDFVVVGGTPTLLLAQGFSQVGVDFPVFLHPNSHHEYALARLERKIGTGHTAFSTVFDDKVSLKDDLLRRDLTINALAIEVNGLFDDTPKTNQVIDYYGGLQDLKNKVLRHVSPAFAEDPLRILRTARFFAKFADQGFVIADQTQKLMKDMATRGELSHLSRERLWAESSKATKHSAGKAYWQVLFELDILAHFLPQLAHLWQDPSKYTGTLSALEHLSQDQFYQYAPKDKQDALAFALLLSSSENPKDITDSAERLCAPKMATELAKLLLTFKKILMAPLTAQMLLELIERTKAHQQLNKKTPNPDNDSTPVIFQLMTVLFIYYQANHIDVPTDLAAFRHILQRCVHIYQQTTIKDIDPNLTGADIGKALTNVRIKKIADVLAD